MVYTDLFNLIQVLSQIKERRFSSKHSFQNL